MHPHHTILLHQVVSPKHLVSRANQKQTLSKLPFLRAYLVFIAAGGPVSASLYREIQVKAEQDRESVLIKCGLIL